MTLNPKQTALARKLFEGALALNPEERPLYLESNCPDDPGLREYVLRLLALDATEMGFLDTPLLAQLLTMPMLQSGEVVRERFQIIRLLGIGGMGEVYEAADTLHPDYPERVALKTIRRDLTTLEAAATRLHREIRLAHRIAHPNVCKVHFLDKDTHADRELLFLIMDFLEGETLSQRLARTGPLQIPDAFSIARQIAAGLDAAHKEGVIHKDLKSANVMLVPHKGGTTRAVIMDFGIACLEEEEFKPGSGTYAYMAPERFSDAGASRPADIYSFGVMLYEMITGKLPFPPGASLPDRRKRPPPPSAIRRDVDRRWDRTILRCLDPWPGKRFQEAADAVDALRPSKWRIPIAVFVLLLILALPRLNKWAFRHLRAPSRSVAILPFEVLHGASQQSGLIDYLAEEIQKNAAIRSEWLVFTPSEARQMNVNTPERAKAVLGATYILTGDLTLEGESLTLAGRLSDTSRAMTHAAFQKTCPIDNAACLEDGNLREIAKVLDPQALQSVKSDPISRQALPYYLQGLEYLRRDSLSYDLAISFLERATAIDPSATGPRVAMADAYILRFRDNADKSSLAAAHKILNEVLIVHPDSPELHGSLGNLFRVEGHYEDARRELLEALQADPSNHLFHRRLALVYDEAGLDADAIAEYRQAISLQPRYWAGYLDFAVFHHSRGHFKEAANLLEELISWAPDHAQGLATLAGVYVDMGKNAAAERISKRSCEIKASRTCYVNLGIALQRQGRTREAIQAYQRALTFGKPSVMLLLNIADAHAYLRQHTEANEAFRSVVARAHEELTVNVRDGGVRAILAYCEAQLRDPERALFELEQARQSSPNDKNVQKYSVLTYESLGLRSKTLETLQGVNREVLDEIELAWGTEPLRKDPAYQRMARRIKSK